MKFVYSRHIKLSTCYCVHQCFSTWLPAKYFWVPPKQWPLAPNSPKWRITRANVSNASLILANAGECIVCRMYRVRPKWQKWPFWQVLEFAKLANFRRVLEFDKFAGEWPLLSSAPFYWIYPLASVSYRSIKNLPLENRLLSLSR